MSASVALNQDHVISETAVELAVKDSPALETLETKILVRRPYGEPKISIVEQMMVSGP